MTQFPTLYHLPTVGPKNNHYLKCRKVYPIHYVHRLRHEYRTTASTAEKKLSGDSTC